MSRSYKRIQTPVILLIAGVIAGLFLLIKPGTTLNAVVNIAAWALILDGAIRAVQLFMEGKRNINDYIYAIAEVVIGILFTIVARFLLKLIPVAVGLVLIALGVYKGKTALELKGKGTLDKKSIIIIVLAVISVIIGVYILFHPSQFNKTIIRLLGAYILIECAENLYAYYLSK